MTRDDVGRLAAVCAAVAILAGCDHDERRYSATDRSTSEIREAEDFDSIDIKGAAHLQVTMGQKESVTIEGSSAAVQRLRTEVRGDTLYIRTSKVKHWMSDKHRGGLTVKVTLPRLASLNIEGGNNVQLSGFDGGETRIKTEGATQIRGSGRLDELTVRMEGAGHADLRDLIANEARVTVSGIGSVYVHPKESLDATMNGIGAILYSGSPPEVSTHMNGLGTISKHNPRDARRWKPRWRHDDDDDRDEPSPDPETLQPEYEEPETEVKVEREVV
jgi:hypothetical protein